MSHPIPVGYSVAGVHSGVKRNPQKQDLALVHSDRPAVAVGVFTKNLVFAAPVALDRERTPSESIQTVVMNSGNANACTGERGLADARRMAALAAKACSVPEERALVLSTGIIGEFLPMDKITAGIEAAARELSRNEEALVAAARGMLTTDTVVKLASRVVTLGKTDVTLTGMAKGAAMIGPRMATMLGVVMTDAKLRVEDAQRLLRQVTDETFNCISVDGHMSTNDTVLLLANGASGTPPLAGSDFESFSASFRQVCEELSRQIVSDGEGITHVITIDVRGCKTREDAYRIAKTVGESPLVKTAIAGADPNWGRIVSAAGYSGVDFDPAKLGLSLNGIELYAKGAPLEFDKEKVSNSIKNNRETSVVLTLGEGEASVRFWSTDLTTEYVRLNADYHT